MHAWIAASGSSVPPICSVPRFNPGKTLADWPISGRDTGTSNQIMVKHRLSDQIEGGIRQDGTGGWGPSHIGPRMPPEPALCNTKVLPPKHGYHIFDSTLLRRSPPSQYQGGAVEGRFIRRGRHAYYCGCEAIPVAWYNVPCSPSSGCTSYDHRCL